MSKKSRTAWNVPVSQSLDNALEEAVRSGTYSTKSDFIRDCVRRKLEEMFSQQGFSQNGLSNKGDYSR